jgi:hypothetical protein
VYAHQIPAKNSAIKYPAIYNTVPIPVYRLDTTKEISAARLSAHSLLCTIIAPFLSLSSIQSHVV